MKFMREQCDLPIPKRINAINLRRGTPTKSDQQSKLKGGISPNYLIPGTGHGGNSIAIKSPRPKMTRDQMLASFGKGILKLRGDHSKALKINIQGERSSSVSIRD